jgi:hypothetical protein
MSDNDFFADGQGESNKTYRSSSHQFTDPIRLFKANDPYYWEVDNIPLQQIQESVLWLKDQVGDEVTEGGLTRADFPELRPAATGDSRTVTVSPGRFTGRVNDAYNTGIATLAVRAEGFGTVAGNPLNEIEITYSDTTLKKLAGIITTNILGDNGLYDFVQHNVTAPAALYNTSWVNAYTDFVQNNKNIDGQRAYDLQHIKLALWKQGTTVTNYGDDYSKHVDLQQLAVEFTRVYGAPFRTSVVNVTNNLTIDVPSFEDDDYQNTTTYVPAVRVDLLFVYTKPIDAESTTILKPAGDVVSKILSPQLGIVKGAGVIALNGRGGFQNENINSEFFNSQTYQDNKENPISFFEASGGFDDSNNMQTASVISDLNQNTVGVANTFANFPSPDDLLNAAPYITEGVAKTNLALVGQSVLPLAYIFVKKGKPIVENSDILDIRPFFRTAELTYNERAGLAAANPPTSLANPVVSKYQLADNTKKLRDYVQSTIPETPQYPRPVSTGFVFGGIKFGPEGVLARLGHDLSVKNAGMDYLDDVGSKDAITEYLTTTTGLYPEIGTDGDTIIPTDPDWDIPQWALVLGDGGSKRNDYFNFWYQQATRNTYNLSEENSVFDNAFGDHVNKTGWQLGYGGKVGLMQFMVRKRVELPIESWPTWMTDYHVRLSLVNCSLATNEGKYFNHSDDSDQSTWGQPAGLYVEKYRDHFNIVCCWHNGDPYTGAEETGPRSGEGKLGGSPWQYRTTTNWSNIFVTSENSMLPQVNPGTATWIDNSKSPMFRGQLCTYPTVHFEIIGYPDAYAGNVKTDWSTGNTVTLTS